MAQTPKAKSKLADSFGNPQIGDIQAAITAVAAITITDADASLGATTQAELEGYFNTLGTAINSLISAIELHGLVKDN